MMPSTTSSRRDLLLTWAALAGGSLAGCTGTVSPDDSSTGSMLRLQLTPIGRSLVDHYVLDLEENRFERDEEALRATLNGSHYETQYRRPFPVRSGDEPAYTRHEGTFYELDSLVVGERRTTHSVLRLFEVERRDGSEQRPECTPLEALPVIDQRAVEIAHMAARARGNEGGYPVGLVERGGYVYRSDPGEDESRLVGDDAPTHVCHRGIVYRARMDEETFHEPIYRADVDPVATSREEMEGVLRAAFVAYRLEPEELTMEERRIIGEARNGGYEETHPFSAPLVSLLEDLDRREYIDGNVSKDAIGARSRGDVLRYGEEYYDCFLRLNE